MIGITMMILLTIFFIILLKKQSILLRIGNAFISVMNKLRFKTAAEKLRKRMDKIIENYNECVVTLAGKKHLLIRTYLLNLLQRTSQILVTVFCYYALHGSFTDGLKVFAVQTYVVLGSNFIPIPGAVGISEFLMYFGYTMLLGEDSAYSLAILGRGISFYTCSIISIFTVILGHIMLRLRKNKGNII